MAWVPSPSTASLPNTLEWVERTKRGDYLVQVAWPLSWGEDRVAPPTEKVKTLYVKRFITLSRVQIAED